MEIALVCVVITVILNVFFLLFSKLYPARRKIKVRNYTNKRMPFKVATDGSVCADCYAQSLASIGVGQRETIPLGFALELPELTEAVIRPRSGLSRKGIDVQIGTIDTDYRGEVSCTVVNNSDSEFLVSKDMRICQIAFRDVPALEIKLIEKLSPTKRGLNGFGSTGV